MSTIHLYIDARYIENNTEWLCWVISVYILDGYENWFENNDFSLLHFFNVSNCHKI